MTETTREPGEPGPGPEGPAETSLLRVIGFPLAIFVGAPVIVLLVLKYLLGI